MLYMPITLVIGSRIGGKAKLSLQQYLSSDHSLHQAQNIRVQNNAACCCLKMSSSEHNMFCIRDMIEAIPIGQKSKFFLQWSIEAASLRNAVATHGLSKSFVQALQTLLCMDSKSLFQKEYHLFSRAYALNFTVWPGILWGFDLMCNAGWFHVQSTDWVFSIHLRPGQGTLMIPCNGNCLIHHFTLKMTSLTSH